MGAGSRSASSAQWTVRPRFFHGWPGSRLDFAPNHDAAVDAVDPPRSLELSDADVDDDGKPNDNFALTGIAMENSPRPTAAHG